MRKSPFPGTTAIALYVPRRRALPRAEAGDPDAAWRLEPLEPRVLLSAAPATTPAQLVSQANNAFAFDLYQQLAAGNTGNVFFSPYSADTALEMALQGANGVTADQMIQALHLPSAELAQAGIQALYQLFQANSATAGYTLSTANRVWLNDNFSVLASFIAGEENTFNADPQSLDFSNPQAAADTINAWVAAQTDGKIKNLIPAADLSPLTALVLTNAIYFKGGWASPFFAGATQSAPFQTSSGQTSTVQMMSQISDFGYYAQSGPDAFQALDLPFAGGGVDMLVILPTAADFSAVQSSLTPALFSQITAGLSITGVDVDLPESEFNETYNLTPALQNLGIQAAFSPDADFSGIGPGLSINFVVQKTFLQVNEAGAEAAAATAIGFTIGAVGLPPVATATVDADHPFIFAIRDTATDTILFLGRVTDPPPVTAGPSDPVAPSSNPPSASFTPAALFASPSPASSASGGLQLLFPSTANSDALNSSDSLSLFATDLALS